MEENHMSLGNQFKAIDLLAIENFQHATALMDEVLSGEVSMKAKEVFGDVSKTSKAMNQFRDFGRYVIYANFGAWDFWCTIGFWAPGDDPDDSLWVGVMIESNPKSAVRKQVIAAFRALDKTNGWIAEALDDPKAWGSVYKGASINTFLGASDHVQQIKTYLSGLLDEVAKFRKAHPQLPWGESNVGEVSDQAAT
jgi:hypothetical protein